ncbi:MAG: tRNA pseudouridine(38-40) synthase TruA [Anaerolineales bacterium]|jgi:tRNA pseudouridine38-40 synthase|uniref:tRNA pseudouridine(38-40) synthase TruA n=1 Tax=Candidatus Villigracilis vicinus TaxID=3140679 RepID=UPI0031363061|nr:tRNA pseudouridine(38-40) synthase TruA [Anaerolineales bacterium]MBK9779010.1 tRNA pseudouridine(38-40) synthase TruA [Anaerolineales bacterium]
MARYQVILAYDGARFTGSQRQANSRTVQGELENALHQIGWMGTSVIMAGRTDTGVHATGQVAAFDFNEWSHPADRLLHALNAKLPADLAVRKIKPVHADFHPRFDALSRAYRYRLFCEPIRDPLRERFAWRLWPRLDGDALNQTAEVFLGTHDFASFGSATSEKGTTTRTVTESEWRRKPNGEWQFEVRADAFLYRMVRRLVFVQAAVAQGRGLVEEVQLALKGQAKLPAGLAPAHGLSLIDVEYGSLNRK